MRRNQEPMRAYLTSLSPYSIFNSNPIMYKDPTGLMSFWDHLEIDRNAYNLFNSLNLGITYSTSLKAVESFYYHSEIDINPTGAYDRHYHLDNYTNAELNVLLSKQNFLDLERHTIQDFYCHTNYIEIMKELGWTNANMIPFEKLDKATHDKVMAKIKGTNNNTLIPGIGHLWEWLFPNSKNPFTVHSSKESHNHDPSKEYLDNVKNSKDDFFMANWGNSDIFISKHYFEDPILGVMPNAPLANSLATQSTVSHILRINNLQWEDASPLAPEGYYKK